MMDLSLSGRNISHSDQEMNSDRNNAPDSGNNEVDVEGGDAGRTPVEVRALQPSPLSVTEEYHDHTR